MYGVAGYERDLNKSFHMLSKYHEVHFDAGFYLGELLSGLRRVDKLEGSVPSSSDVAIDIIRALQFYGASSRKGNMLALHRVSLALAHGPPIARQLLPQIPGQSACMTAAMGLKGVAEVDVIGMYHSPFSSRKILGLTEAFDALEDGDESRALIIFSELASLGLESAQSNAAALLEHNGVLKGQLVVNRDTRETLYESATIPRTATNADLYKESESRALHLYSLSSAQGNVEAFLYMGDIHYYGRAGLEADKAAAVTNYQAGADLRHPHALFNLGLMYEIGDGVSQVSRFFLDSFILSIKCVGLPSCKKIL